MTRALAAALTLFAASAHAEPPAVVADIPAVGALAKKVMGDLGTVSVLLPQGGNAHSYQLRPSEARAVQGADLLIWIGPELTPWLARAADSLATDTQLRLLALPQTHRRPFVGDEDHADHDHHGEGHDHMLDHEENQDHGSTDPHAWLDPQNGQAWLRAIADVLSDKDPENAEHYRINADHAAEAVAKAEAQISARLAPHGSARIAVSHDAYGYFTDHFRLPPAMTLSLGDAASPSAARLTKFREHIDQEGVRCIFPEAQQNPALLASAIEGTGATLAPPLDPSGSNHADSADLYTQILEGMGNTLADCLDAAG